MSSLLLEDRLAGYRKEISLRNLGREYLLTDGDKTSRWRVFSTVHRPSAEARREAGELAERESLPLIWAVPTEGGAERGHFWAFFPTEYKTTLSGILNAPWKTNEDRQNLLKDAFNSELIGAAAELVANSLAELADASDPARHLDLMPARGRESPNWADGELTARVYEIASAKRSLPDQRGLLDYPGSLRLHPRDLSDTAKRAWAAVPSRPDAWCHHGVDARERRSRAERLIELAGGVVQDCGAWLEALTAGAGPAGSANALRVAADVVAGAPPLLPQVRRALIVLTQDGDLMGPVPGKVYLPGEYRAESRLRYVHEEVARDPLAREALAVLGIEAADPSAELDAYLAGGTVAWGDAEWRVFWLLVRRAGDRAQEILRRHLRPEQLKVRTLSGEMRPIYRTLLPGSIVPGDGGRDPEVAVDTVFHEDDLELLRRMGATPAPVERGGSDFEPWFEEYRSSALAEYTKLLGSARPQLRLLRFEAAACAGPLTPLTALGPEGAARFTEAILHIAEPDEVWRFGHESSARYPVMSYPSPPRWMVGRYGYLPTSLGPHPVRVCVSPALREWGELLPVARCEPTTAVQLELPTSLAALSPGHWDVGFTAVHSVEDDRLIGAFYSAAARHVVAPNTVWCRVGSEHRFVVPSKVHVVGSVDEFEALVPQATPTLLVASNAEAQALVRDWGLLTSDNVVRTEVTHIPSGDDAPLYDVFPLLADVLGPEFADVRLIRCSTLRYDVITDSGRRSEDRDSLFFKRVLYVDDGLSDDQLLVSVGRELNVELGSRVRVQVVEQRRHAARMKRVVGIRREPGEAGKLLAAIGGPALRRRLPEALIASVAGSDRELSGQTLAELALAVHGVDTLKVYKDDLADAGLLPPAQWAGSSAALAFVAQLGFSREYAGFEGRRLAPLLEVEGPPDLPALHEFQRVIASRVRDLLRSRDGGRGLLSLPTGAGKTRVAVEAIIEAIREGSVEGPLLWIAQTEELCEQAVQTWAYVWRGKGSRGTLAISRLWSQNEATAVSDGAHVVVATIDKLQHCIGDPSYDWLASAAGLVIDEAHGSTTHEYTELLNWVGLGRGRDGIPLVGLTATPFRGVSADETERLVKRYGGHRLDHGVLGDDPYSILQDMGVLARVRHQVLPGASIDLSPRELEHLKTMRRMPAQAESRLGADARRNRILIDSIKGLAPDWTVLLFAASVDHAQAIAALLTLDGIPAAAITGETDPGARRLYIDKFRKGELRVLTNYAVLTQGFDAPAVRAVYVARPTYSPNLYQQMIGRGLRGPRNGGKDECLIVNVEDNVRNYGEQLAFTLFEYLWNPHP